MKLKRYHIQLRTGHFVVSIVVFFLITVLISNIQISNMSESDNYGYFPVFEGQFPDEGYNLVFFYDNECELCDKMRYNLEHTALADNQDVHCFEVNVSEHPDYYYNYNVSGVPNVLIFEGEKEVKRVMGVVSQDNIKKIYNSVFEQ